MRDQLNSQLTVYESKLHVRKTSLLYYTIVPYMACMASILHRITPYYNTLCTLYTKLTFLLHLLTV